jgi:HAE1 family hydrophobic/amphiphilic exporter-1
MFWILELVILGMAGVSFAIGGIYGYIVGILLIIGEVWAIVWYERGGHAEIKKSSELSDLEWESDEHIKKKLRDQAEHTNLSFGGRLVHGILNFDSLLPIYEKAIRKVVSGKKQRVILYVVVTLLFVAAVAMPVTGIVQTEFFPPADDDYVYVDIRLPVGQKLDVTNQAVEQVEEKLLSYSEIANFSTIVGQPSPLANTSREQSNVASITISLKSKEERGIKAYDFADKLRRDIQNVNSAEISVATPGSGPPSGSAFEARIKGDDLSTLDKIAHELEPKLSSVPGVINVDISLKDSAPEYTFTLDPVKLEQNNLNAAYVGSMLRMAISGTEVSTVIEKGKETKIIARIAEDKIPSLEDLQNMQILNFQRRPVFLKDIARIELKPSVDSVTRIDQKRTVLLSADASSDTNSNQILAEFKKNIEKYNLPSGYSIVYGGQNEQNTESVTSVIMAMIIAMVLIVATLIIQFNSFRKAVIVLVTIPLALIGVFIGMAAFGVKLSFPGLIGVLALFGIVVKNAIILVDKMNLNIKSGIPFVESVVDAGKSRLEAIFITSICTIFGILPVTLSNELWRALGSAVIFGLMLSSFLTLFVVPTLYISFVKQKKEKAA